MPGLRPPMRIAIRASGCTWRTGNPASLSATRSSPNAPTWPLHPEYAEARLIDRRVERGRDRQRQRASSVLRSDDAVVPEACRGVVRVPLGLVLLEYRTLELL